MSRDLTAHPVVGREAGMTLVEVLAVVVILGMLAGTLAVSFSGSFGKAKSELARASIAQIAKKVELYRFERGDWPGNDVGLAALSTGDADPGDSYYLEPDQLVDPWQRPYYFVTPGPDRRPYEIVSYGADGAPGGDGEDADLSSASLRGGDR